MVHCWLAGYPWLGYEHLIHHACNGDTDRGEWPRLDESVWHSPPDVFRRIVADATSLGAGHWLPGRMPGHGQLGGAAAVSMLTWVAFAWAGGWSGLLIYGGVIVGITFGFQAINYLQHWGLGDDSIADAGDRPYAWEDDCLFQAWQTLHISFHQLHRTGHRRAAISYPQMPCSARNGSGSPRAIGVNRLPA